MNNLKRKHHDHDHDHDHNHDRICESDRYIKIVSWSEPDNCYIGLCPEVTSTECRGDDERDVFETLCNVVEETVALHRLLGKPLPGGANLSTGNRTTSYVAQQSHENLSRKSTTDMETEATSSGTPYRYRSTLMSNQNRFLRDCSIRVRIS